MPGGFKRKLCESDGEQVGGTLKSSSSSSAPVLSRGLRRSLHEADEAQAYDRLRDSRDDLPLNKSLRMLWCKGQLSSPKVQELALVAQIQGAHSVGQLAKVGNQGGPQ